MKIIFKFSRLTIVTIILLHLSSISIFAQNTNSNIGQDLRIMTFNIRYGTADDGENSWQFRNNNVFTVIKNFDPDIVGLQEALKFQIDEIKTALPEYEHIGVGRDDGKEAGEYSAILYKKDKFTVDTSSTFWFSDTPDIPGSKHWGNNITRICTRADFRFISDSAFFTFYNLHLDHESPEARLKSTQMLVQKIISRNEFVPTIITGDFNEDENSPELKEMRFRYSWVEEGKQGDPFFLKDCFRMMHTQLHSNGTFHSFTGDTEGERIDFIFVSNNFEIKESNIVRDSFEGRYPSDHFPVTAVVKLKK